MRRTKKLCCKLQESVTFTELEDFKRVLSMASTPRDRAQQSSFGSDAKLLGSRSLNSPPEDSFPSQISQADFSGRPCHLPGLDAVSANLACQHSTV